MKRSIKCFVIVTSVMMVLPATLAVAQQPVPESSLPMQMQSPAATSPSSTNEQSIQPMQKMDKMADSVTKMSEMCQMMMQKEMASAHYKMAVGLIGGILLFVALVLFVILEVQWIIYWSRLLKSGKAMQD